MQDSLRAALKMLAPGVHAIQRQAQQTWSLLQQPLALGQDNWLLLRPKRVALSRIDGRESQLNTRVALTMRPLLVTAVAAAAAGNPEPLPPLGRYYPRSAEMNLHLGMNLDFATLGQRFSDTLAGRSYDISGHKASIRTIELGGSGQEIRARVELAGAATGTAKLRARVAFDPERQRLELQDLGFDYHAQDSTMASLVEAFHEPIRRALENVANEVLVQQLDDFGERLRAGLHKIVPAGVALDLSALQLDSVQISIEKPVIRLEGVASGSAQLMLR